MNNDIYEVSRDEYVGFINQIKPEMRLTETTTENGFHFIKTYSVKYGTHLCTRIVPTDEVAELEHYFIFNMPRSEERCAPKPVKKIILETQEEVQAFFDIVSKISKETKTND